MIRSFFGLVQNPFSLENLSLLPQQQEIYDFLQVHSHQGGFCLILGEPGTGKSVIKEAIKQNINKRTVLISISRTLHTYTNMLKIFCDALNLPTKGLDSICEKYVINEVFRLNQHGKALITLIDDAHLLDFHTLRKLRLLFEDFPKNHNLILIGQPDLLHKVNLCINEDIKSRITFSHCIPRLNQDDINHFIFDELDRCGLGHNTFSEEAIALIIRSCDGILRKARNLALACLIEAVRQKKKQVDLANVNRVLIQPHWRVERDLDQS